MSDRLVFGGVVAGIVAVVALVLGGIGFGIANALHEEVKTCTVTDTTRWVTSDGKGGQTKEQRVYTEECGILTVEDALFAGAFNSADTFHSIEEGHVYRFTTRGHRIGFLSAFPNIVKAEEVSK